MTNEFADLDTNELVTLIGRQQDAVREMADALHRMEYALQRRMEADGATAIPHPDYVVTLKRPVVWDRTKLAALGELVPPDILATCFTPRHEETVIVEAAYNMTVGKTLGKYGRAVQEVLDAAKGEGPARLSVTARKEKTS